MAAEKFRIRGTVQGVGFRPTVARLARERQLAGLVYNDEQGVTIALDGSEVERDQFLEELMGSLPPLARIDHVERQLAPELELGDGFRIVASSTVGQASEVRAEVPPDVASCPACMEEVQNPYERRFRYPFATCTNCGPRYSVTKRLPFDREQTTMAEFSMCSDCRAEYEDPNDRRYHAQTVACFKCGPTAVLERMDGRAFTPDSFSMHDSVDAAGSLIRMGEIVAVKGLGGYHLCCDATNESAVAKLRSRKRRYGKPLAMMARDLDVIRKYAEVDASEEAVLTSPAAPIVLLDRSGEAELAPSVAPGYRQIGFMLPYTPMHVLMMKRIGRPVVCTSGNISHEPQCTSEEEAKEHLASVADWILHHNRPIVHRVDDSVVHITDGQSRVLRRARGMAPASFPLPPGADAGRGIWAAGAQLKSTFTLAVRDRATVSPHIGDLDELKTIQAYSETHRLMSELLEETPELVVVDAHPEYRSTQIAKAWAQDHDVEIMEVQHHHAHVAAVMTEHQIPVDHAPVLGVALDGYGLGSDGSGWGGEFLACTYRDFVRVGTFKPVPIPGGDRAAREPWRNLFAHLRAEQSWAELECHFGRMPLLEDLRARSEPLEPMLDQFPVASSCGRLFDAVAAAVGVRGDLVDFEGQAAMELEASIEPEDWHRAGAEERYPIGIPTLDSDLPYLEPLGMWRAILSDLLDGVSTSLIASRFHWALAEAVVAMCKRIRTQEEGQLSTVALAGGCFQNRHLLMATEQGLLCEGFTVLSPAEFPANDGALSLGQAAMGAARRR